MPHEKRKKKKKTVTKETCRDRMQEALVNTYTSMSTIEIEFRKFSWAHARVENAELRKGGRDRERELR